MPDPSGTCDCAYVTCAQLWVSMSLRPLLTVNKMTVQNDVVHFVSGFPNKKDSFLLTKYRLFLAVVYTVDR